LPPPVTAKEHPPADCLLPAGPYPVSAVIGHCVRGSGPGPPGWTWQQPIWGWARVASGRGWVFAVSLRSLRREKPRRPQERFRLYCVVGAGSGAETHLQG
jgi:hypothetical protein